MRTPSELANRTRKMGNIHNQVKRAVKLGLVKRPKTCPVCDKCGKTSGPLLLHAHHSDYSKPLDVEWMCTYHHMAWHRVFEVIHPVDGEGPEVKRSMMRKIRERLGLSHYSMGLRLGMTQGGYRHAEAGSASIRCDILVKLFRMSGLPLQDFWLLLQRDAEVIAKEKQNDRYS